MKKMILAIAALVAVSNMQALKFAPPETFCEQQGYTKGTADFDDCVTRTAQAQAQSEQNIRQMQQSFQEQAQGTNIGIVPVMKGGSTNNFDKPVVGGVVPTRNNAPQAPATWIRNYDGTMKRPMGLVQ